MVKTIFLKIVIPPFNKTSKFPKISGPFLAKMYRLFCTLCKMIVHNRSHDDRLCYHTPRNFVVYFGNFFLLFYSTELYGYGVSTQSLSNKVYLVHKIIPLINNLLIFYKRFYLPFVRKKIVRNFEICD